MVLKLTLFCFSLFFFFNNVATATDCRGRRTDLLVRCKQGVCEQGFLFQYKSTESRCQNFIYKKTGEEIYQEFLLPFESPQKIEEEIVFFIFKAIIPFIL